MRVFWMVLIFLTAACWYLALRTPAGTYPRDWRLKPFHLTRQEEQDFHKSVRRVLALAFAIFFSVCLIIALITALLPQINAD